MDSSLGAVPMLTREHSPFVLIFNMQSGNFLSMVLKLFHAA